MATDYPVEITDPDGSVRIAGLADFIDPDNQPGGLPIAVPGTGTTDLFDAPAPTGSILSYDADAGVLSAPGAVDLANGQIQAGSSGTVGFFNTDPVGQPAVPATPLPQDIVDALVALGLVAQAS